jgi:hypothetical protein
MPNPFTTKAKVKKKGKLAQLRVKKKNGSSPEVPKFRGIQIDEPNLDELGTWERQRYKKRLRVWAESDKQDYTVEGLRLCHVREHDGYWTIDVVNGDYTVRFDNRYGSWMIHSNGFGHGSQEAHPRVVYLVHTRWLTELKRQGREVPYMMRDQAEKKQDKRDKDKAPRRNRATGPANAVKDPPPKNTKPKQQKKTQPKRAKTTRKWGPKAKRS